MPLFNRIAVNVIGFRWNMERAGFKRELSWSGGRRYITLSQLKSDKIRWNFREITSYNLTTSTPTYRNANSGRDIEQADVDEINRVLEKYEINTPERIRHFLAQCYAETNGGFIVAEQFNGDPFEYFRKYETGTIGLHFGNNEKNDGAKFRGAGAIQTTGKINYRVFSEYIGDPKILTDGALYVGQKYFWESAGFYWSIYKPNSADPRVNTLPGNRWGIYRTQGNNIDIYDLNGKIDRGASVREITGIINTGYLNLDKRQEAYDYYKTVIS